MSKRNPYTYPGKHGSTHKRFPKQAKTRKELTRLQALRPRRVVHEN